MERWDFWHYHRNITNSGFQRPCGSQRKVEHVLVGGFACHIADLRIRTAGQ